MKRLRKSVYPKTLRFFMCAEYGEKFSRPHYHACIFNHDFPDKDPIKETEGLILYNSPALDKIWGKGYCSVGDLTFETAAYTARYILKKINGDRAADHYETTDKYTGEIINLQPEFSQASLKPGLGKDFLIKYTTDLYPSDFAIYKNKKIKLPRYYDKVMEFNNYDLEEIKVERLRKAKLHYKDNTPSRLRVREEIHLLKQQQIHRNYENDT